MILIPKVLAQLLRDVGEDQARLIALDYARHAVEAGQGLLDPHVAAVALSYLNEAGRLISGEGAIHELAAAHRDFHQIGDIGQLDREILQVVRISVTVACQRELESGGVVMYLRYRPKISVVAKSAQAVVVRIKMGDRGKSEDRWRCEIWSEARWQLIHLLEVVPIPHLNG
ncbi:hypothetical protein GCM10027589_46430 [Actinocorallia lasiicapitis]